MSLEREDVEKTIQWEGGWKVVYVRSKDDHMKVRNGKPTKAFWDLWRQHKDEIKQLGTSVKKEENEEEGTSEWKISYWQDADDTEKEEAREEWEVRQKQFSGDTE